ncbi:hypothetical protein [Pseudobutyrivibrio sp.]
MFFFKKAKKKEEASSYEKMAEALNELNRIGYEMGQKSGNEFICEYYKRETTTNNEIARIGRLLK